MVKLWIIYICVVVYGYNAEWTLITIPLNEFFGMKFC